MEKHEMMSLEDSGQLRDKIRFFEQELLKNHHIDPNLYVEYNVKRGLRDSAGKGVLTGLTEISDVNGYNLINGRQIPADGRLYYQGINVQDIISGLNGRRFGFEETIYLLIFGKLPDKEELSRFLDMMSDMEELGGRFVRDVVMKGTNANIMNAMQRCVLALYTYDDNPEDISPENVLRQSLELIAKLPEIAVYSYHAYRHFRKDDTLFIRNPQKGLSLAENILLMLRPDGKYTELEAKVLDIALILHAEHGGGNNSTFTTHVVTSSGTDTYSSTAASIGSLKGPRHGGANLKVQNMFADLKSHVDQDHWDNEDEIITYLKKVLNKEAFDHAGLIYGMGHAVYTLSDPREVILKRFAQALAEEKGMTEEFELYNRVENIADLALRVQKLVPDARVSYAHGQMNEHQLEDIMYDFINGDIDVLVSTTIIETGLDIANANTMIIQDADRFGLSQLYQLRGRVGRSNRMAYAFLLYQRDKMLKEVAEKRLAAIREFTDLGSGFKIAMRDLEIRGAGNLLGAEQHGHMEAVGYDMYCKMLNEAVKHLKGELSEEDTFTTALDVNVDAYIPDSYIPNEYHKLDIYKRIAAIESEEEMDDMIEELIDRFGDIPKKVELLLEVARLKNLAHQAYVTEVTQKGVTYTFRMYEKAKIHVERIPDLLKQFPEDLSFKADISDPKFIYQKKKKTKRGEVENPIEVVKKVLIGIKGLLD